MAELQDRGGFVLGVGSGRRGFGCCALCTPLLHACVQYWQRGCWDCDGRAVIEATVVGFDRV